MNFPTISMKRNSRLQPETSAKLTNIVMQQTDADKLDLVVKIFHHIGPARQFDIYRDLIIANASAQFPDIEALREFGNHCCRLADALETHGDDLDVSQSYHIMGDKRCKTR